MEPREASAPFNKRGADLILQSSDLVNFRVLRAILREASEVFADMLSIPQSPEKPVENLSVVQLVEDSDTLDAVLRFCYPVAAPSLTISNIGSVLAATVKYCMDGPAETIKMQLERFVEKEPLRVYAIAKRHNLNGEMGRVIKLAATNTLSIYHILDEYNPDISSLDSASLFTLMKYRQECSTTIDDILGEKLRWLGNPNPWVWYKCQQCAYSSIDKYCGTNREGKSRHIPARWWSIYVDRLAAELRKTPTPETIFKVEKDEALEMASECPQCKESYVEKDLRKFCNLLKQELEHRIALVTASYW